MTDPWFMYVIYDRPKDFPDEFVVRKWSVGPGRDPIPLEMVGKGSTVDEARIALPAGLSPLPVFSDDDVAILEVWG